MRDAISSAVENAAAESGFVLDANQHALVEHLTEVVTRPLSRRGRSNPPRGVYVYGPAGRGKSWLVNAVFVATPAARKVRVHSHEFFPDLHARVHAKRHDPRALSRALDDMIGSRCLLFFDELHVHDPGDARLLTRLLEHALSHDTTLLATSNYAPNDLLPNPVWHHIAEPGIDLITKNFTVVRLNGTLDHRTTAPPREAGFAAGTWVNSECCGPPSAAIQQLESGGRSFSLVAAHDRHLCATFAQICESPLSTLEYMRWASLFDTWTVVDIPLFGEIDKEAQQRFIHLIDILADRDIRSNFESPHTIDDFLMSAIASRPDAFRMVSRMRLLRCASSDGDAREAHRRH